MNALKRHALVKARVGRVGTTVPTGLVTRIDLDYIYPPFLERALNTLAACYARQVRYVALQGFRSITDQAKDYFQGRTTPGKIITNARPGYSWHQYGAAMDVCRDGDFVLAGLQPRWDAAGYVELAEEAKNAGIQAGVPTVPGGDKGHIQPRVTAITGRKEIDVLRDLKALWDATAGDDLTRLKACWGQMDKWGLDR